MDKISVITVSLNAENTIRNTIESVLNQTYKNIQYIIVDGESADSTYSIICEYEEYASAKNVEYLHVSENDNGIYDAMNKGIRMVTGDWVIFLNANDYFFDGDVIQRVFGNNGYDTVDCIYGNTINVIGERQYRKNAYPIDVISYKAPFIHQALFVRSGVIKNYPFDLSFKVAADYDQFCHMYKDKVRFERVDCIISYFDLRGVSQKQIDIVNEEWKDIQKKYGLSNMHPFRRFLRNEIVLRIKRNKCVYDLYSVIMALRQKITRLFS